MRYDQDVYPKINVEYMSYLITSLSFGNMLSYFLYLNEGLSVILDINNFRKIKIWHSI